MIVKLIEGSLKDTVYQSANNWPFVYAPGIFALFCGLFLIIAADRTKFSKASLVSKGVEAQRWTA